MVSVGMVFFGSYTAFLFFQTRRVKLMPKSLSLVSYDHSVFTGKLQTSLYMFLHEQVELADTAKLQRLQVLLCVL